jgi:ribosome maturation factor RimP
VSLEQTVESKIKELSKEICEREGFVLYDVEYLGTQKIVRIYIDKEGGVGLDDCAKVSSGVNFLLDVEDPIENKYSLEVSSPGLERRLSQKWHYEDQIGKEIFLVVKARTETSKSLGTKNVTGVLKGAGDDSFTIESPKLGNVTCPYEDVHRCNLVFYCEFNFGAQSEYQTGAKEKMKDKDKLKENCIKDR